MLGTTLCSYEAVTERKATKCLDFSYFKLNDLKMTIKVSGKNNCQTF